MQYDQVLWACETSQTLVFSKTAGHQLGHTRKVSFKTADCVKEALKYSKARFNRPEKTLHSSFSLIMKYLKSSIPDPSKTHTKNGWSWSHDLWPGIPGLWSRSRDCDPWSHIPGYDPALNGTHIVLRISLFVSAQKNNTFSKFLAPPHTVIMAHIF